MCRYLQFILVDFSFIVKRRRVDIYQRSSLSIPLVKDVSARATI